MRSVFIFPYSDLATTVRRLDELSPRRDHASFVDIRRRAPGAGYPWVIDGTLYADLAQEGDDLFFDDWEPEGIGALEHALGRRPQFFIQVDVSGRIDGTADVRRLTLALLVDGGVAVDDYSHHPWTQPEIAANVLVDGLRFFDFRTGYERSQDVSSTSA